MPSTSTRRLPGTSASLVCRPVQGADKHCLSVQVLSCKLYVTLSWPVPCRFLAAGPALPRAVGAAGMPSGLGAGAALMWLRNTNKLFRLGTQAGTSSVLTLKSYWCDSLAIYLFKATELFAIFLKSKHGVWAGELFCLNVHLSDSDDNLSE